MGVLDAFKDMFTKKQKDRSFMTDDERELREYEENEYKPESKLADDAYAELIVGDCFPMKDSKGEHIGAVVVGTVSVGTFNVGDMVQIEASLKENTIRSQIVSIEQFRKVISSVSEGAHAGLLLRGVSCKQVRRNAIVKKLTGRSETPSD
ncbi:MAG: hypothetical protein IJM44_03430 [Ruminococcus sp.]|nr:hypothetical protein [Ruminococcus sp.]